MVTVSEDNFCEVAFHDVCYDCVHMHVGVYMDTLVCVCIYVHYTMHVHMHMCARPHHVCLSWLCSFPLPPHHTLGKNVCTPHCFCSTVEI